MTQQKAKRRLRNFDFSANGSHLALVHKDQGGAANGYTTLITKATNHLDKEHIEKAQLVQVTMELPEFLEIFHNMYEDQAEVLAAMFGYKEGESETEGVYSDDYFYEWYEDKCEQLGLKDQYGYCPDPTDADYKEWIASRLEGIEILKSLYDSSDVTDTWSTFDAQKQLTVLRDQERIEKALMNKELVEVKKAAPKTTKADKKPKAVVKKQNKATPLVSKSDTLVVEEQNELKEVEKAVEAETKQKGKQKMTKKSVETTVVEVTTDVEMVSKAELVDIQKQFEAQQELLQKATEQLQAYKQAEQERISKARKQTIVDAVEVEEEAEKLFKAVGELEDSAFEAVVSVIKALKTAAPADPMFSEQGIQKSAQNEDVGDDLLDQLTAYIQKSQQAKK